MGLAGGEWRGSFISQATKKDLLEEDAHAEEEEEADVIIIFH